MAKEAPPGKKPLQVKVCTNIDRLHEVVRSTFASSSLAQDHELILQDIGASDANEHAEILLADPGKVAPILDSLRGLRWLQSSWAGINSLAAISRRDFTCTRLAGCLGPQMAEYVIGAILSEDWLKLRDYQQKAEWAPEPFKKRRRLCQMTVGVLGVGDIASVVAQRCQSFGMKTLGFATRQREVDGFSETSTDLTHVLKHADVIVNLLPSTPSTRGLLDGQTLRACSGVLLVNVGRGDVVSEASVLEALEQGWLRRAVLDVFSPEPLPATSGLWGHPAVQVSPHISAVSFAEDVAELFIENLGLWVQGKPLRFVADLDKGY